MGQCDQWGSSRIYIGSPSVYPLLFIPFVNDLPDVVEHCTVNLYSDDTAIYVSDEDPGTVRFELEWDLQRVSNWISTNRLRMNITKTQLMVLSSRKKQWLADSVHVNMGEGELLRQVSGGEY